MQKNEILANARSKFNSLKITPQDRARDKINIACEWIYRNGFASADILNRVIGASTRSNITRKLTDYGLIKPLQIPGGGLIKDVPQAVYTLTNSGLAVAENLVDTQLNYDIFAARHVRLDTIRHDLLVQKIVINALNSGTQERYFSERELKLFASQESDISRRIAKIPDAILEDAGQNRVAIELELTGKWSSKFDKFALGLLNGISRGDWNFVNIFVDTEANYYRYIESLAAGAAVYEYILTPARHLIKSQRPHIITSSEAEKIRVLML